MLIEFTTGNYLSFKDKKTLSLEATSIKDNMDNIIQKEKYKLLRSVVIYGANSSGKSNFLKALETMRSIVLSSAKYSSTDEIEVSPFLLNTETENEPSFFEILFLINNIRYRYGFEVDRKIVHSEWLFECKNHKENNLFIRDKDSIEVSEEFDEGKSLEIKTRENALFLSIVDQFNGTISKGIMAWFSNQNIFSGLQHEKEKFLTAHLLTHKSLNRWIIDFLKPFSLGFEDFSITETGENKSSIKTIHNKYDATGNIIAKHEFDLLKQESSGTNKLYDMAGSLTYGLSLGLLTVIDELDAKLHPLLTMAIVKLFNSPTFNKNGAQLIFASHDTNLLNHGGLRRDQIYFTEKNRFESTDLYSLVEYRDSDGKKIRNDSALEKNYIMGRYGAIPYIGNFNKLVNNGEDSED